MKPVKITLLSISMFIVLFLLFAAAFDFSRCLMKPEDYYYSIISQHVKGSALWYWDLFTPNLIIVLFCLPKLYIMKKYSSVGEENSIWNSVFYFAFVILIIVCLFSVIEIFDTPDIEIIQNV
jgi:hypothetical protein